MDWTKFSIATFIGGVSYFFLGWLIYGFVLRSALAMPSEISAVIEYPPEEFKMSLMIISCLVFGALLSLIMIRWAGVSTFGGGLKVGAIIGALISLSIGLSLASMFKMNTVSQVLIDTLGNSVCSGIAGGVIGWYLGRGKE